MNNLKKKTDIIENAQKVHETAQTEALCLLLHNGGNTQAAVIADEIISKVKTLCDEVISGVEGEENIKNQIQAEFLPKYGKEVTKAVKRFFNRRLHDHKQATRYRDMEESDTMARNRYILSRRLLESADRIKIKNLLMTSKGLLDLESRRIFYTDTAYILDHIILDMPTRSFRIEASSEENRNRKINKDFSLFTFEGENDLIQDAFIRYKEAINLKISLVKLNAEIAVLRKRKDRLEKRLSSPEVHKYSFENVNHSVYHSRDEIVRVMEDYYDDFLEILNKTIKDELQHGKNRNGRNNL